MNLGFDQGFEPKDLIWPTSEYGDFTEKVAHISAEVPTTTFLKCQTFPMEITKAPVTELVCSTPESFDSNGILTN
jgi:hypothetical protein